MEDYSKSAEEIAEENASSKEDNPENMAHDPTVPDGFRTQDGVVKTTMPRKDWLKKKAARKNARKARKVNRQRRK